MARHNGRGAAGSPKMLSLDQSLLMQDAETALLFGIGAQMGPTPDRRANRKNPLGRLEWPCDSNR